MPASGADGQAIAGGASAQYALRSRRDTVREASPRGRPTPSEPSTRVTPMTVLSVNVNKVAGTAQFARRAMRPV
jgi:hypothetical protein